MTKLKDLEKVRDELAFKNACHEDDYINGFNSATSIFTEREKHLMSVIERMKAELKSCSYDFKYICNQKNISLKVDSILGEVDKMMGEL